MAENEEQAPVLYEVRGTTALVTMNRPQYRNAQNAKMTYALDEAFNRAINDDAVKVIVPRGRRQTLLRRSRYRHAGTRHRQALRARGDELVPACRQGRRRGYLRARTRVVPRYVPALARHAQADGRHGAGRVRRGRTHARVDVRSHRRVGRCLLRRSRGEDGYSRCRVFRASLRDERAPGEGVPLPRRERWRQSARSRSG